MANIFNSVQGLHPRFNSFSAHTYRNDFTAPLGVNIPVYIQHVVPNTRVKVETSALVRLQALLAPIMDNIDLYVHFWKCPYRLIEGDRFTQFISGEIPAEEYTGLFVTPYDFAISLVDSLNDVFGGNSDKVIAAYVDIVGNGGILDFLGYDVTLFPTLAYSDNYLLDGGNHTNVMNWRELIMYYYLAQNWYMNENVPYYDDFAEDVQGLLTATDIASLTVIMAECYKAFETSFIPHGWEKDYFTSALPNVQFGEPVRLPIVGNAPVSIPAQNFAIGQTTPSLGVQFQFEGDSAVTDDQPAIFYRTENSPFGSLLDDTAAQNVIKILGKGSDMIGTADLSEASAITINELRFANALQVFKERQLRYGRRRQEYYKGFFDVTPEDLRLQLPKYLGGGRIPINIADIEQTSASTESQKLGRLAGKATAVAGGFAGFTTFCSEESIIIGIAFAMPHITYGQSLSRFKLKTNDIYDYFNPSFEHLGEQEIKYLELYAGSSQPNKEFGYTPRYNEYRFHMNEMHGAFKDSLSFWTLGRLFDSQPTLNVDFVYMQPSVFNRIFAVEDSSPMLASVLFRVRIVQPVSKYGTPMLLA